MSHKANRCAIVDIVNERTRQIKECGYSAKHDDNINDSGELTRAAIGYAKSGAGLIDPAVPPQYWPWSSTHWKPADRRADLVKAGALIVAEIERIDREEFSI